MNAGARQTVLFNGPGSRQTVVVFVKTTHTLVAGEPMARAPVDLPLTVETISDAADDAYPVRCTERETDLWELKPCTDVVVRGHVHTAGGHPRAVMDAGVCVGTRQKWIRITGDRHVELVHGGVRFSPADPFVSMPLSWRRAYGGVDLGLPLERFTDVLGFLRAFTPECHPGAYPRNPAGRGWVIHAGPTLDGLKLPNLETPTQLLAPENLVVGDPARWSLAPIPAGFGWWRQGWFPRSTLLGLDHPAFTGSAAELPEVQNGWLSAAQVDHPAPHSRFQSGASPGLRFDHAILGAPISLHGLSPDGPIHTKIPRWGPEVDVRIHGSAHEARVRLSSVELLPDSSLANLVWVAETRPDVRLPIRLPRVELSPYELLEGVRVTVDGEHVPNDTVALCEAPPPERRP